MKPFKGLIVGEFLKDGYIKRTMNGYLKCSLDCGVICEEFGAFINIENNFRTSSVGRLRTIRKGFL